MFPRRLFPCFLLALSACSRAEGPQGAAAITAALSAQAEAWNRHDAKAWVAPFTEDADFVNIVGMSFAGRPEVERRHDDLFKSIFSHSRVVMTTRKVVPLGPTAALTETVYELRDYDRLPPGIRATDADGTLRTRMKNVWVLKADGWRIVAAQNTAIAPLPPKP